MPLALVRRNVQAGFTDAHGFHPLRSSVDYDPDAAGDDYGARTDGSGLKYKPGHKPKPAKKRKATGKRKTVKRNGRSFVRRGESVPSWYTPKAGEVWFVDGKRGVIKRVGDSEGTPYVWFVRPVDGTLAMSIRNLVQAGRLQRPTASNPNRRTRSAVGAKAQYKAFQGGERAKIRGGRYGSLHGPMYVVKGKPYGNASTAVAIAEAAARRSGRPVNVSEMIAGRSSVLHVVSPDGSVRPGYHRAAARLPNGLRPARGTLSPRVGRALTKYVRSGGKRNPGKRWTISGIKSANKAAGKHYFDKSTMQFFNAKIFPTVYQGEEGVYFISSSQFVDSSHQAHPRTYKVARFYPDSGRVENVGGTQHPTLASARDEAKVRAGARVRNPGKCARRNPGFERGDWVSYTYRDDRGTLRSITGKVAAAGAVNISVRSDGGQPGFARGKLFLVKSTDTGLKLSSSPHAPRRNPRDAAGGKRHWQIQSRDLPTSWHKTKAEAMKKIHSQLRRGKSGTTYITLYNTKTGEYTDLSDKLSGPGYGAYPRKNPSKVTYRYVGGKYVSSRKRPGRGTIVSLPKGYVRGADGVYRYKRNPAKRRTWYAGIGEAHAYHVAKMHEYSAHGQPLNRAELAHALAENEVALHGQTSSKYKLPAITDAHPEAITRIRRDFKRYLTQYNKTLKAYGTLYGKRNPGKAKRAARAKEVRTYSLMGIRRLKGSHTGARRLHQYKQSRARGSLSKSPYAKSFTVTDPGARNPARGRIYVVTVPKSITRPALQLTIRANKQRTAIDEAKTYLRQHYELPFGKYPRGIKAKRAVS